MIGKRFSFLLVVLSVVVACSQTVSDVDSDMSAKEIIRLAEEKNTRNKFREAAEIYLKVDEYYPYSDDARLALIEAAKAYHASSQLLDLRITARRYLNLYPKEKSAPLAKYLVGMSYFEQIIDVERDQGAAMDSLREFKELIELYPSSDYAKLARTKFSLAVNQLAGQEMSVGRYYFRKKNPLAAIKRFQAVLETYPQTAHYYEAQCRLIECYLTIGADKKATAQLKQLTKRFPDNEWTMLAKRLLIKSNLKE